MVIHIYLQSPRKKVSSILGQAENASDVLQGGRGRGGAIINLLG